MAIRSPGARLLRDVPFSFMAGGERAKRQVDAQVTLIPFIDLLLTVVVFLLMSFSSSGEVTMLPGLPHATNGGDVELAPLIAIDADQVTIDGRPIASTRTLLADGEVSRLEPLITHLDVLRRNYVVLHGGEPFPGTVVVQASQDVDFRALRKVLFSVGQAGYGGVQLAVRPR